MSNIFTTRFPKIPEDEFEVFITKDLFITADPYVTKDEWKHGLVEMVDMHSNLILAYSGGMDSSFVLCCIRDLIEEKRIPKNSIQIVQGSVTVDGYEICADKKRAFDFAKSIGFEPKIYNMELDNSTQDEIEEYIIHHCITDYASAAQDVWSLRQPKKVIMTRSVFTNWGSPAFRDSNEVSHNDHSIDKILMCTDKIASMSPHVDSNGINMEQWNSRIYSSLITPYKLNKRPVNLEPFRDARKNGFSYVSGISLDNTDELLRKTFHPLSPERLVNDLSKNMAYLQCYPEMTEVLYKFSFLDVAAGYVEFCGVKNKLTDRISNFRKMWKKNMPDRGRWTPAKKLDGEVWTTKDLLNYGDYFETV